LNDIVQNWFAWSGVGLHVNSPVEVLKLAPKGSELEERVTVSPSLSGEVTVKDTGVPVFTLLDAGTESVGGVFVEGSSSSTGTVWAEMAVSCGLPLSTVLRVTV